MTILEPALLILAVATPFAAAVLILVLPERAGRVVGPAAAVVTAATAAGLLPAVSGGSTPAASIVSLAPGIELALEADALGLTFTLLASGLWIATAIYNNGYADAEALANRRRYFACFAAAIGSATGVALAENLLAFLIFYEALTVMTYPLVAHHETREAIGAARRYLAYALSGGLAITLGAVWAWRLAGTLAFTPGGFLPADAPAAQLAGIFVLLFGGCAVKAAVMPLHAWLPAAMVAPAPVSALLHAVAVVKAGVFGCLRILGFVFGPAALAVFAGPEIVLALCLFTIVAGSLLAVRQRNLKRRLAYSTVVHLSYIVAGGAMASSLALTGAVLHMVNHGLTKITLFLCAGAIHATAHAESVDELRGLGRRMPWTFGAFAVAALSLTGVPGLCGFVGKLFLGWGAADAEHALALAVLLGASLLTAAYLWPIVRMAFFESPDEPDATADAHHPAPHGDARLTMRVPLCATAAAVVVFGALPGALALQHGLAERVGESVFASDSGETRGSGSPVAGAATGEPGRPRGGDGATP